MTSINTNAAAMTALQTLQTTNQMMDETQNRISTGFRVAEASDNAAYWSIATGMRSDNKAISAVEDSLGLGAAKLDIAYTALDAAINLTDEIKSKLVAALEPGVDKTKIQSEIGELKKQLLSVTESASFSGENWLQHTGATAPVPKQIVSSFTRTSGGGVSVGTIEIPVNEMTLVSKTTAADGLFTKAIDADGAGAGTATYYLLAGGATVPGAPSAEITIDENTTPAQVTDMMRVVDKIVADLTTVASNIGASKSRVEMQQRFVSQLMDVIDKGVGTLVDADMTEESTRLKALQTQQQLGVQALSIANTSSQSILQLFQN